MNAKDKIEELAVLVAEDALKPETSPEDRREALKILNPHYTMLLKSKAKSEDVTEESNFEQWAQETDHGGAPTLGNHPGGRA